MSPDVPAEQDTPVEAASDRSVAPVVPDPAPVLIEVAGETGGLLWRTLRDVIAWASARPGEQGGLFGRGVAQTRRASLARVVLHPELSTPVGVLVDLTANPGGTRPLLVMHACLRVARHLRERHAGEAALAFAQAAALVSPGHPWALLEVGRLLGPARADEALACLEHAASAAEAPDEPELAAEIHVELAALAFRRRERRLGRAHVVTAIRAVRRARRDPRAGRAG